MYRPRQGEGQVAVLMCVCFPKRAVGVLMVVCSPRCTLVRGKEHSRRLQTHQDYVSHQEEMGGGTLSEGQERALPHHVGVPGGGRERWRGGIDGWSKGRRDG